MEEGSRCSGTPAQETWAQCSHAEPTPNPPGAAHVLSTERFSNRHVVCSHCWERLHGPNGVSVLCPAVPPSLST